jgi:hypothetical protein
MKTPLLFAVFLYLNLSFSNAQDGHYWSENYGNKSMLLSGTVNASVTDLGLYFTTRVGWVLLKIRHL